MKRLKGERFFGNRGLSPTGSTKLREERHESEGGRRREVLYLDEIGFSGAVFVPFQFIAADGPPRSYSKSLGRVVPCCTKNLQREAA